MIKTKLKMWALLLLMLIAMPAMADDFNSQRTDFRDESIYFMITTRFYDGDPKNNVLCWDNKQCQIDTGDPCWRGDFQGVIDKLDYIKALGFTAIWITPVVQNASGYDYHGYHAIDFTHVDCRYQSGDGSKSGDVMFQELIDKAHAKGIKIILDIVLNHTGNFGEQYLCKEFERNTKLRNQAEIDACMIPNSDMLGSDYLTIAGPLQYQRRLALMKNTDGQNHDIHNYWHHTANNWNWDFPSRWMGQIAGDCVDLNTENDEVAQYLVKCYGEFIKMGVDGFRIDTSGHISRLTFNKQFIPQFTALGEQYKSKRLNQAPFFMYGEVCTRMNDVTYRGQANLSCYFYTWKSDEELLNKWDGSKSYWDSQDVPEGADPIGPQQLCLEETTSPKSNNAKMLNGAWHEPDYSQASGFNVIDFPMHYSYNTAQQAFGLASGDELYNDATYNVVYVDSHDYSPGPNDLNRFGGTDAQWAENLSLLFTFRGIPCIYYGSEIGFRRGVVIDKGPNGPLSKTGRAYFGGYITGDVTATDFGDYKASGNVAASLNHDVAQHIIRLNKIRQAVPALRKGQWTTDGCKANNGIAFKRAYKDSYALVALNGGATFTDCPAGKYTDVVTGKTYTGTTITVEAPATQGQVRVLVKDWTGGVIGEDGPFIYTTSPQSKGDQAYDGQEEAGTDIYYGSEDIEQDAAVVFNPNGGNFRTETVTVTATLNDGAASGWYQIEGQDKVELSSEGATFTIGSDMKFGDTKKVKWGATNDDGTEYSGTTTYRKVDPNASIIVYVKANSAPNLYAWVEGGEKAKVLNGDWPGKKMSTKTTIEGVDYYMFVADGVEKFNIILNNGSGAQTGDITDITATTFLSYDGGSGYKILTDIPVPDPNPNPNPNPNPDPEPDPTPTPNPTGKFYVYFAAPTSWSNVKAWVWDSKLSDDKNNYTGGTWPGEDCVKTSKTYKGMTIWMWEYKGDKTDMPTNLIFDNGGSEQTKDLVFENGKCYDFNGVNNSISITTGINGINANAAKKMIKVYTLNGECVGVMSNLNSATYTLRPGIYIANGRKFVVR